MSEKKVVPLRGGFGGGGGAALNFRIVDGENQPATGKENDIWVAVEKVTGYYFQAEQPEEMADGEVWISTGTISTVAFNALKEDTIMVYPLSAKQMVDGVLVNVTAKSYQGGEWVEWISFLYDRGKIGLGGTPELIYTDNSSRGFVTLNDGYITVTLTGNAWARGGFPDAVDFSAYSTMTAIVKAPSKWSTATQFRFGVDSESLTSAAYKAQALNGYTAGTEYTITLDISSYNEKTKPWFELYNGTGAGEEKSLYVLEIDLE